MMVARHKKRPPHFETAFLVTPQRLELWTLPIRIGMLYLLESSSQYISWISFVLFATLFFLRQVVTYILRYAQQPTEFRPW